MEKVSRMDGWVDDMNDGIGAIYRLNNVTNSTTQTLRVILSMKVIQFKNIIPPYEEISSVTNRNKTNAHEMNENEILR